MLGRLGQVIYWAGCGVAAFCVLIACIIVLNPGHDAWFFIGLWLAGAMGVWLSGRAVLYVLAGR